MNFLNFDIKNKIFSAPMAGITDLSFRTIARKHGAGLCYTEMVSAKALTYSDKKTKSLLKTDDFDQPLIVQLFGSEPDILSEACKIIEDMGFLAIDINCGCPAPKITSNGEGSALMKNPPLIGKLIEKSVNAVSIPITVKIRSGYTKDTINAIECATIAQNSGAKAITVHGRTRDEFYSGNANYSVIKNVKENVNIPVIGNGDVFSPIDAKRMFSETNCDYIMIGRGSLGNPFIFENINYFFENKMESLPIPLDKKISTLLEHVCLMTKHKGEHLAILEARKHLAWYLKGVKNSKIYKDKSNRVQKIDDVKNLCQEILLTLS